MITVKNAVARQFANFRATVELLRLLHRWSLAYDSTRETRRAGTRASPRRFSRA